MSGDIFSFLQLLMTGGLGFSDVRINYQLFSVKSILYDMRIKNKLPTIFCKVYFIWYENKE